jgi:hypothetical protein
MTSTPFDPEQLPDSTAGTTGATGTTGTTGYIQGSLKWAVALTASVGKLLPFCSLPEAF